MVQSRLRSRQISVYYSSEIRSRLSPGAKRRAWLSLMPSPPAIASMTFSEPTRTAVSTFLFPEASMNSTELIQACVYDTFAAQAELTPAAAAIKAPGRLPLTYSRLLAQLEKMRKSLNAFGFGRNDRIVTVLDNGPEMAVAFMGLTSCVTAVPLNPAYRADEFRFYVSRLNAKALVVNAQEQTELKEVGHQLGLRVIELVPQPDAEAGVFELHCTGSRPVKHTGFAQSDDVALILHTSGTTSAPKIVPLTHENICAQAKNNQVSLKLNTTDLCLNIMPLFHSTGLVGVVLASLISGAGVICPPGFYAPKFFDWLEEF